MTSNKTLISQFDLNLRQRCVQLRRKFRGLKLTPTKLLRVYRDQKIKFRAPILRKILAPHIKEKQNQARREVFPKLLEILDAKRETVLWLDESVCSGRTIRTKVWTNKDGDFPTNCLSRTQFPAQSICGATDRKGKLVAYQIADKSFNSERFKQFLELLRKKVKSKTFHIFLDNCTAHKTNEVKNYCKANGINLIFNSAHSPEFNPIERLWWLAKKIIRRLTLKSEKLQFSKTDIREFIRLALAQYDRKSLASWTNLAIKRVRDEVNNF